MKMYQMNSSDPPKSVMWEGGLASVKADGNFGGGILSVTYCETLDGTYVPMGEGLEFASGQLMTVWLPSGYLMFTLSGSTGATVNFGIASACMVVHRSGG